MTTRRAVTAAEVVALAAATTTTDVPTAARALGLGTNLAYESIARGDFPCRVLRLGRKLRVPTAGLLDVLGIAADARGGTPAA